MDISNLDYRYVDILHMIVDHPGIRYSAIVGKGNTKLPGRIARLEVLVTDGLVTFTDTPHRGRYGFVREYTATPYGLEVDAKLRELEAIQPKY